MPAFCRPETVTGSGKSQMHDSGTDHLCVRIADIAIAVNATDGELRLRVEGPMRKFLVEEARPEVTVGAAWGDLAEMDPGGEKVFDSGGSWQLVRNNGHYVVRCVSPSVGQIPYKLGYFEPDFTSGTVLLHHPYFPTTEALYPLDYPLDELLMSNLLARGRGVELHACGMVDPAGNGHLFVGQSGAGKTTTARLWMKQEGVRILSDDRIVVRRSGGEFRMYGTPWHGEAEIAEAGCARLKQLYFLRHGEKNELAPQRPSDAVGRLFAACFPPFYSAEALGFTLSFLGEIVKAVPCYELGFIPDESAIHFILKERRGGA